MRRPMYFTNKLLLRKIQVVPDDQSINQSLNQSITLSIDTIDRPDYMAKYIDLCL